MIEGLVVVGAVLVGVAYGFYSALNKFGKLLGWIEGKQGKDWAGTVLVILWVPFLMFLLAEISKGVSVAHNVTTLSTCPHPGPAIQRGWYCVMQRTDFDDWRLRLQSAGAARRTDVQQIERERGARPVYMGPLSEVYRYQRWVREGVQQEQVADSAPRVVTPSERAWQQTDLEFAMSLQKLAVAASAPKPAEQR